MKAKTNKDIEMTKTLCRQLFLVGLMIFGLNGISHGMDQAQYKPIMDISLGTQNSINEMSHEISFESSDSSPRTLDSPKQNQGAQDMSGAAQSSIEDQRNELQKKIQQDSDGPDQDSQKSEPRSDADADDDVSDNPNIFGFICGRSQCCFYQEYNPQDDCGLAKACCCLGLLTLDVVGPLSGCIWSYGSCCWCTKVNICCPPCTVVTCSPTLAAVGITGAIVGYGCIGCSTYGCSRCMGFEDFAKSYERGKLWRSDDTCSCTSIFSSKSVVSCLTGIGNCWNDCWIPCWSLCCGDRTKKDH